MTGTNHALTGAIIGLTLQQPLLAIPLAFGSHFVLDALPHYGDPDVTSRRFMIILSIDALAIAALLFGFISLQPPDWALAFTCAVVAACPDFMWLPNFWRSRTQHATKSYYGVQRFHKNIQWAEKPYNWPYEIAWLVLCLFGLAKLV